MVDVITLGPILTLLVVILAVVVAIKFGNDIIWLVINSLVGLVILWLINLFPFISIEINIWSILIVVFGGIPGIALLIILDLFGIAF